MAKSRADVRGPMVAGTVETEPAPGAGRLKGNALAAAIVASSDEAIIAETFDGTVLSWNRAAEVLYGYRAEEMVGTNVSVLAPYGPVDDLSSAVRQVARGTSVKPFETARRHKDGTLLQVAMTVSAIRDGRGDPVGAAAVSHHVLAAARPKPGMVRRALHDSLTGLPNRALGEDRLSACMGALGRQPDLIAVLFVDLDHFKDVNDRFGHSAGDQVLRSAASRLLSVLRPADSVYRYGGDEFVIVCPQIRDASQALSVADRVAKALRFSFEIAGGERVHMTASIGVAVSQTDDNPAALIQSADRAMYKAKGAGRARVELYRPPAPATIDLVEPTEGVAVTGTAARILSG